MIELNVKWTVNDTPNMRAGKGDYISYWPKGFKTGDFKTKMLITLIKNKGCYYIDRDGNKIVKKKITKVVNYFSGNSGIKANLEIYYED